MKRVAVGLSGGVDSAVAAMLLKQQGYEVVGVHLYCYPAKSEYRNQLSAVGEKGDEELRADWIKKNGCRADEDRKAALKTALELSIPFKVLDFSEEYNRRVIDYFYREYEAGRTPNPDVLCNGEIKFGLFLDWALANGFDYVATGHYARNQLAAGSWQLSIPKDTHKDQTYFLWKLGQKELAHVLFPLSDLLKSEVRKIAKKEKLAVAERPDSQGICFVGNIEARKFLARRLKEKTGAVKNVAGETIGTHKGIWFYTIGQRGGWQMAAKAQKKYSKNEKTPVFYVVAKNAEKNELTVALAGQEKRNSFGVGEVNWIGQISQIGQIWTRIRHGGKLIPARLEGGLVILKEPQRGVAPGQSAVFYSEAGEVLGGGVIG